MTLELFTVGVKYLGNVSVFEAVVVWKLSMNKEVFVLLWQ